MTSFGIENPSLSGEVTQDEVSKKADKIIGGQQDNLISLDNEGNIKDSGKSIDDFETISNKVNAFQTIPDNNHYPSEKLVKDNLDTKLDSSLKGSPNGLAELDSNGTVPSSQLPGYVDDVLEYNTQGDFPTVGESGKIYVSKDNNLTYRWSGSDYIEISSSLALGETSSTAYRGDRGKTAYDHSQTSGNPHGTNSGDILTDTTNFSGILSSNEDTIQKALDKIDDIDLSGVQSDFAETDNTKAEFIKNKPVVGDNGLTEKNFTLTLKNKLDGIAENAEVNVQSDYTETDSTKDSFIKNKPDLSVYELNSNKVTAFQSTPDDTHYPSEKLVKDSLDLKANDNNVVHTDRDETVNGSITFKGDTVIQGITTNDSEIIFTVKKDDGTTLMKVLRDGNIYLNRGRRADLCGYDTRNRNPTPQELTSTYNLVYTEGVREFKYSSTLSISGAETYGTLMTYRRWSSGEDRTGGGLDQIFLSAGKIWTRTGTQDQWGAWTQL